MVSSERQRFVLVGRNKSANAVDFYVGGRITSQASRSGRRRLVLIAVDLCWPARGRRFDAAATTIEFLRQVDIVQEAAEKPLFAYFY